MKNSLTSISIAIAILVSVALAGCGGGNGSVISSQTGGNVGVGADSQQPTITPTTPATTPPPTTGNKWNNPAVPNARLVFKAATKSVRAEQQPIGNQYRPTIAADSVAKKAFTVWFDDRAGNGLYDIYAQCVDFDFNLQWDSAGMPVCVAANAQTLPAICVASDGNPITAWQDNRFGAQAHIFAQKLDAITGAPLWTIDGLQISPSTGEQTNVSIVPTGDDGGAIVIWIEVGGVPALVAMRISSTGAPVWLDDNGQPKYLVIDSGAGTYRNIAGVPTGTSAIFAWDQGSTPNLDIFTQKLSNLGTALWNLGTELQITNQPYRQQYSSLCSDNTGGAFETWMDDRSGGTAEGQNSSNIYIQHVMSDGSIAWQADGVLVCGANGIQRFSSVGFDGTAITVAWEDLRGGARALYRIRLDPNTGLPLDGETPNGTALTSVADYPYPLVLPGSQGGFDVLWTNETAGNPAVSLVQYNHLNVDGTPAYNNGGLAFSTDAVQRRNIVGVPIGNGRVVMVWEQTDATGLTTIYGRAPSAPQP